MSLVQVLALSEDEAVALFKRYCHVVDGRPTGNVARG